MSYSEKDPLQLVKDLLASTGRIGREDTGLDILVTASELADVGTLLSTRRMRELDEARVRIANHVCVEDVDDRTRRVPVDREVRRLMKMGEELRGLYETEAEEGGGGGGGGADAAEASSTAKSASKGGTEKEIFRGAAAWSTKIPRTKLPKITEGVSSFPDNNLCRKLHDEA